MLFRIVAIFVGKIPCMEQEQSKSRQRGSEEAKQWALRRTAEIGEAVHARRVHLGLSASQLANRTKEIGYPITRGAIAKIESNSRSAKLDVNELLVLAAALQIAPVDLLFPGFPSFGNEVVPQCHLRAIQAGDWFSASEDYRPFGIARAPRSGDSIEMRRLSSDLADLLTRSEQSLNVSGYGEITPAQITREQASAVHMDILRLQGQIQKMGGSVGLPVWFFNLEDLLRDESVQWLPF